MIRVATGQDLAAVLALYHELRPQDPLLTESQAEQTWQQMCADPHCHVVVAEVEGQLAASCTLTLNIGLTNGARPFGMIEHVITASAFRRRGLSQQVLGFAIELAWQLNCYKVMLLSGEQLHGAHRLYESVGMQSGIERGFVIKPPLSQT